jgi:hypothetical protein
MEFFEFGSSCVLRGAAQHDSKTIVSSRARRPMDRLYSTLIPASRVFSKQKMPTSHLNFGSDPSLSLLSCLIHVSILLESDVKLSPCDRGCGFRGSNSGNLSGLGHFQRSIGQWCIRMGRSPSASTRVLEEGCVCVDFGILTLLCLCSDVLCNSQGFSLGEVDGGLQVAKLGGVYRQINIPVGLENNETLQAQAPKTVILRNSNLMVELPTYGCSSPKSVKFHASSLRPLHTSPRRTAERDCLPRLSCPCHPAINHQSWPFAHVPRSRKQ